MRVSAQICLMHSQYRIVRPRFGACPLELLVRDGFLHGIVQPFKDVSDGNDGGIDVKSHVVLHIQWLDDDTPGEGLAEDLHGFGGDGCRLGEQDGVDVLEREGDGDVERDGRLWGFEGYVDGWVWCGGGDAPSEGWGGGEGFGGVGRLGRGCGGR